MDRKYKYRASDVLILPMTSGAATDSGGFESGSELLRDFLATDSNSNQTKGFRWRSHAVPRGVNFTQRLLSGSTDQTRDKQPRPDFHDGDVAVDRPATPASYLFEENKARTGPGTETCRPVSCSPVKVNRISMLPCALTREKFSEA